MMKKVLNLLLSELPDTFLKIILHIDLYRKLIYGAGERT